MLRAPYITIVLFVQMLLALNVFAIEFEQLTIKNGLPDNTIIASVQDKKGFIWIATQGGLSRYNGFSIDSWNYSDGKSCGPLSNKITCLAVDTMRNLLYLGHYAGLSVFDITSERFEFYTNSPKNINSLSDNFIRSIVVDYHGRVWIGTEQGGLCEYIPEKKTIQRRLVKELATRQRITGLATDPNGKLWIASQSNTLLRYNPDFNTIDSLTFRTIPAIDTPLNHGVVLMCDHSNRLWIGTEDDGVFVYDVKIRTFIKHFSVENSGLRSNFISDLYQDKFGAVWIGSDKGGLARWRGDSLELFRHVDGDHKSLSSNIITDVFESHDGCLWVGTYNAGLSVYKRYKHKFLWAGGIDSDLKLPGSEHSILSFAETRDGILWLGTDGGGLLRYNVVTRQIERVAASLPSVVKSLIVDKNGLLWVGSYGHGLWTYNPYTKQTQQREFADNQIINKSASVWALYKDSYDNIWIGVLNNGVYCLSANQLKMQHYQASNSNGSLSNNNALCFFEDSKQNIWIGTDGGGLNLFNRETKSFTRVPLMNENNTTQIAITSLIEDRDGNLWVGSSQKGLFRVNDSKGKTSKHFGNEWGVPQRDIVGVECDMDNSVWICTKSNIYQFNEADSICKMFDMDDGLQQAQFSPAASFRSESGILFFGGADGFNQLDTRHIEYQTHAPQAVITSFELFNRPILPNDSSLNKMYLQKSICYTDTIFLHNSDYSFAISFAALDYTLPQSNEYQYMLEGFDTEWNTSRGIHNRVVYTNLPGGEYTFWVRASNCDNVWGIAPVRLTIFIGQVWWKIWWIWIIAFLVLTFTVYFVRIALKKQKKQSELDLEMAVEERNKSLIERNAEFQLRVEQLEQSNHTKERLLALIGQDLKNPFNVLINFSGLLVKEFDTIPDDKRPRIFAAIHQSSTSIYNMMSNLLDWARSQTGELQYNPQPLNLYTLVDGCISMFSTTAEHKRLHLVNDTSPDFQVFVDEEMIKTVFRNLISNSIKYSFENGSIKICSRQTSHGFVEISVIDEGMGMSKEHAERLFSLEHASFYAQHGKEHGTGLGLLICKEYLEQHGSIIKIDSVLHRGSTVVFYLPLINI